MKKGVFVGLVSAIAISAGVLWAEGLGITRGEMEIEMYESLGEMTRELNLTDAQRATIQSALLSMVNQIEAATTATDQAIRAVLNADQLQQYEQWKANQ